MGEGMRVESDGQLMWLLAATTRTSTRLLQFTKICEGPIMD